MENKKIHNLLPVMGISLIMLGLMVSLSSAIFGGTIAFSEYGGVIIESNNEVSVQNPRIARAGSTIASAGTAPESPVVMASTNPLPLASTGVSKGNWYYRIDIYSIAGKTPINQIFKVELYRWNSASNDYTLISTLYIKSTASPTNSEGARLYFDLGSSNPESSEAFMVTVSRI